ncbi:ArsR/SmtB family transcription factor [Naumannella huperziae]
MREPPEPVITPARIDGCATSLAEGAFDEPSARRLAGVFKALGDPTRVRLVSLIAAAESAGACICDLTGPVGLSQPTVSHHMRVLVEAGLVARQQRGRWAYYRLVGETFEALSAGLDRAFERGRDQAVDA